MHPAKTKGCNKSIFGDKRLDKRNISVIDILSKKPSITIPQAFDDNYQAKACYRLWDNEKVNPEKIQLHQIEETKRLIENLRVVLIIHDITGLDFSTLKETIGLGYLEKETMRGIKVYTSLAVSPDGMPLGLLHQEQWIRPLEEYGKKALRKQKPIEEKESYQWIKAQQKINEEIAEATMLIHIADRESDIYEFFICPRKENQYILIRFAQNRRIKGEHERLKIALDSQPVQGSFLAKVSRKKGEYPEETRMSVKYLKTEILAPKNHKNILIPSIELTAIEIFEENPKGKDKPIKWYLLTDLPVKDINDAITYAKYYTYRWLIERYHYTLKSGCQIENLQLKTASRLMNSVASYCIAGWRIMQSTYLARFEPEAPASEIVNQDELEALYFKFNPQATSLPDKITVIQAVTWIARLGGFMARKGDGMPGLKVMWRGLLHLYLLTEGWVMARNYYTNLSKNNFSSPFPYP